MNLKWMNEILPGQRSSCYGMSEWTWKFWDGGYKIPYTKFDLKNSLVLSRAKTRRVRGLANVLLSIGVGVYSFEGKREKASGNVS